jgi:hypothetical protein
MLDLSFRNTSALECLMSAITPVEGRSSERSISDRSVDRDVPRRLSTETKSAFKTTEFMAYVVVLAGTLIAGAVTKASGYAGSHDPFRADRVWLYVTVLTVGYMVSRGIAKAGSRQPYDEKS